MEVKYTENPEGLHIDIEDLIGHLEQEADDRERNILQGLFKSDQNEFWRGEVYGYRRIAKQFRGLLGE